MLIREVTQPGMDKMVALVQVLSGRAEDTGAKKEISVQAFVNLAKSLGIVVHEDDIGTLVSQEPMSNVFEPVEPNSGVLRFKGNDEQTNNMPVDAAKDIVAQNAKRAMKNEAATSRVRFNESWLPESPEGIEGTETHSVVAFNIRDLLNSGIVPSNTVDPNVKKIVLSDTVYYWVESNGNIELGVELSKKPDNLTVNMTGKDAALTGQSPFADDLYRAILDDTELPLLFSDIKMTNSGKKIWKRLVNSGKTVSIYDRSNPGQTRQTITNPDELDQFWKLNDVTSQRWQYVLSESGRMTHDVMAAFNTRRARELTGMGTEEHEFQRIIYLSRP